MIDVKRAIASAKTYARDVLEVSNVLLEEFHSKPKHFEITLSFPDRNSTPVVSVNPAIVRALREEREYKTFEVSKATGEVLGMSDRLLV